MKKTILLILIASFANSLTSMDQNRGQLQRQPSNPINAALQSQGQQQAHPQDFRQQLLQLQQSVREGRAAGNIQQDYRQEIENSKKIAGVCFIGIVCGLYVLATKTNVFETMAGWFH